MSTRLRRVLAALLLVAAVLALFAWRPWRSQASAARIVTVGVYDNPPKIYTDRNGRPAGLFIDLLRPIAQRERWSLRFVSCAWEQCLRQLAQGRIDLMPDVAYSDERSARFDFPHVAAAHSWSEVYRSRQVAMRSIVDLGHRRVAVLGGSVQERYLRQLMSGAALPYTEVPVASYAEGFRAVRDGRADAVVTNAYFGSRNAREYGLAETPIMFQPVSLYFAAGKGRNAALLARIDQYLGRWRQDPDSPYYGAIRRAMAPAPILVVPRGLELALAATGALAALLFAMILYARWQVRRATGELERSNRHLDHVLAASPVVLHLLRREGDELVLRWVSPNLRRLFGFSSQQALAPGWWHAHVHPDDRDAAAANLALLGQRGQLTQVYRLLDAGGRIRHIHEELRVVESADGRPLEVVGTWNDLSEAREHEAELEFLARHDLLTGLPNRLQLQAQLAEAIARARTSAAGLAVLSIDLDRFRNVNDTLGHAQGDELLRAAAHRIANLAGPDDLLARLGGDKFVLVLDDAGSGQAAAAALQLVQAFSRPLASHPHPLVVTASVGVSLFPADGEDADTLLKHAELAHYEAKNGGRNTWRFFASSLSAGVQDRLALETALRGAVDRNELVLHYQPQVRLDDGALVGVEALVRWAHPELGFVPPGRFITLAEEIGIIHDIGRWVLCEACAQLARWDAEGLDVPCVAVNLSMQQIRRDTLPALVADALARNGLAAGRLELEVTESSIMREPEQAIAVLGELKAHGVKIAVDDFGTGHSSLAYVQRLPLDRLKIDQSFVRDIGRDDSNETICRTVIELARSLGLEAIAEGVERPEQVAFLRAEGCRYAQGYLFARPLPAAALREHWLAYNVARRQPRQAAR